MPSPYTLWPDEVQPALVMLIEDANASPWDTDLGQLVDELEDRLENVPVHLAGTASTLPELRDAIWAAQFAGASSAVVVADAETSPCVYRKRIWLEAGALPVVITTARWSPEAIAEAYTRARLKVADSEAVAAGG